MSLKGKLTAGMIFVCMGLIILALTGYLSLNNVVKEYEKLVVQSVPKLGDISGLRARAAQLRADSLKLTLFAENPEESKKAIEGLNKSITRYREITKEYKEKTFFSKEEEQKLSSVDEEAGKVLAAGEKVLALFNSNEAGKVEKMKEVLIGIESTALEHQKRLLALDDYIVESSAQWSKDSNDLAMKSKTLMSVIAVLTIAISIVGATIFSLRLSKILQYIADQLSTSSNEVGKNADRVSDASNNLSSSTTEQASALQETVTATTEVASMIQTTAENTQNSLAKAESSKQSAINGQNAVNNMLSAIDAISKSNREISEQVEKSNNEMKEIVDLINNINEKTKVINEIVFQTKLLSFNASVEAARAGEAGKGFAVVAEEVSKLAEMSGGAAEEIRTLLEQSNSRVESIISATRENVTRLVTQGEDKVQDGVRTADGCKRALDEINNDITEMVSMSKQITEATKEQSMGVSEINSALESIGLATNQNADASRQCSLAADELKIQVSNTHQVVNSLLEVIYGNAKRDDQRA
nr:methyl-accepting chemotaxis protein [Bacteriovorax sp. HI3]